MRHLDYADDTPVTQLGPAAIDDLLERGDLRAWAPVAGAVREDPHGPLADVVLRLCDAHPMYGTSKLWRSWIERVRREDGVPLAGMRRRRGLTQQFVASRLGISQSDVSKLERRADLRVSTLREYVEATGGRLELTVSFPSGEVVTATLAPLRRPVAGSVRRPSSGAARARPGA